MLGRRPVTTDLTAHEAGGPSPTVAKALRSKVVAGMLVGAAGAIAAEIVNKSLDKIGLSEERSRVGRAVIRGVIVGGLSSTFGRVLQQGNTGAEDQSSTLVKFGRE